MKKLRGWLFLARFYPYTVFTLVPRLLYFQHLTKKGEIEKRNRIAYDVIKKWADFTIRTSGQDVKVYGAQKIPRDRPVLFISNHQSYADVPTLLYALRDLDFGFILKSTMAGIPFIKKYLEYMSCVSLNQSDMRQAVGALNLAAEYIDEGKSLLIFPEGKRSFSNTPAEFKNGAFKIVRKTGVTVVPIYLHNVHRGYEGNDFYVGPSDVTVTILDPIETKEMSRTDVQKLNETVYNVIYNYSIEFKANLSE